MPLQDLDRRSRRRIVGRAVARIVFTIVALLALYAALPAAGTSGAEAVVKLIVGLLIFAGVLAWQVKRILGADYPALRAAEALAVAVITLIIVFAFTYLSVSHASQANFSEPLDHVGAIYFTVSTLGTVGFGDVVAKTEFARILVTVQIILDLGVLVGIGRALLYAARVSAQRQRGGSEVRSGDDAP